MTSDDGPIGEVREGMRVVDVDGEELGSVEEVRMSDPDVVTSQGQGDVGAGGGLLAHLATAFGGGSGLSEQAQERLTRLGYVRVAATGAFSGDRYVAADEIVTVAADTVHLNVSDEKVLR